MAVLLVLYRIEEAHAFLASESPPCGFVPRLCNEFTLYGFAVDDLVGLFAILAFYLRVRFFLASRFSLLHQPPSLLRRLADLIFLVILICATLLASAYLQVVVATDQGLTLDQLRLGAQGLGLETVIRQLSRMDYLNLSVVIGSYLLVRIFPWPHFYIIAAGSLYLFGILSSAVEKPFIISAAGADNPFEYLISQAIVSYFDYKVPDTAPSAEQRSTAALEDAIFLNSAEPGVNLLEGKHPDKVILLLMESTSAASTTLATPDHLPLMPHLAYLGAHGLNFINHYSGGNYTPNGLFSLLSGYYAYPGDPNYPLRLSLRLPMLNRLAGCGNSNLFVSPCDTNYFFPKAWFNSNHWRIVGYDQIPANPQGDNLPVARDEIYAFPQFEKALSQLSAPYVAVYFFYATHYPYPPVSIPGQPPLFPGDTSQSVQRHANALRAFDHFIGEIMDKYKDDPDPPLLIVTSDHGEAFGQHPHVWTHGNTSFEEELHTPLVMYCPGRIPAQTVTRVTSHADVVPSILDALSIHYHPMQFQGTSVFRPSHRLAVYASGLERSISFIGSDRHKWSLNLLNGRWTGYDLVHDPNELSAEKSPPERVRKNLFEFVTYQQFFLNSQTRSSIPSSIP